MFYIYIERLFFSDVFSVFGQRKPHSSHTGAQAESRTASVTIKPEFGGLLRVFECNS